MCLTGLYLIHSCITITVYRETFSTPQERTPSPSALLSQDLPGPRTRVHVLCLRAGLLGALSRRGAAQFAVLSLSTALARLARTVGCVGASGPRWPMVPRGVTVQL